MTASPEPEVGWLYNELQSLRTEVREQHQRLRSDMNAGFALISNDCKKCTQLYGTRLTVIETERTIEQREQSKTEALHARQVAARGTVAGAIAAAIVTGIWSAVLWILGQR
jgi:cell division septum initiation protein DivIVA